MNKTEQDRIHADLLLQHKRVFNKHMLAIYHRNELAHGISFLLGMGPDNLTVDNDGYVVNEQSNGKTIRFNSSTTEELISAVRTVTELWNSLGVINEKIAQIDSESVDLESSD